MRWYDRDTPIGNETLIEYCNSSRSSFVGAGQNKDCLNGLNWDLVGLIELLGNNGEDFLKF
jgi:hypothetical protein